MCNGLILMIYDIIDEQSDVLCAKLSIDNFYHSLI